MKWKIKTARLFLRDWWCFNTHRHQFMSDGEYLCTTCDRVWRDDCCISRDWKQGLDELGAE